MLFDPLAAARCARRAFLVGCALLWPSMADAATAPAPSSAASVPTLGASSRAWLRAHPSVTVGMRSAWPPVDGTDAHGVEVGLSPDVLAQAARLLGVRVQVVPFPDDASALSAAEAGRVDLLGSVARTPSRERALHFTQAYLTMPVVYFGHRGVSDFSETGDFGGRRIAVERGSEVHEWLQRVHPGADVLVVDDTLQALRAVAAGRADVYKGALLPAHHLIERELLANLEVLSTGDGATTSLAFASTSEPCARAFDAALRAMGPGTPASIAGRWQPGSLGLLPGLQTILPASGAIAAMGEVRVTYDAHFAPISVARLDGTPGGLAPALFRRAADGIGLRYRIVASPSFRDADQALHRHDVDVVLAAVRTPERLPYAEFVGPYYSEPTAIVSRLRQDWPTLGALVGHRLAIDADHYLIPVVQREYPGITLVVATTADDVLRAVDDGRADAGVTNVEVAAAQVGREFAGRLQISGLVQDYPSELFFMVRRDRPDLVMALRAGLANVPPDDRRMLANTLLRTEVHVGLSPRDVVAVVVPVLAAMTGLLVSSLLHARRLRRMQTHLKLEHDKAAAAVQARENFIAELGHDVRTPLAALTASLLSLQREGLGERARSLIGPIIGSAERTLGLLNRLLDAARMQAGHFELHRVPVDVVPLVRDCVESFTALAADQHIELSYHAVSAFPRLLMDIARTQQVVNNLVSNAVKFARGGRIHVTLSGGRIDTGVWKLKLIVADTGVGMTEAQRQKLFQRFAQAPGSHEQHGGTGLGLAICAEIIGHAGGHIDVESEPGRGTTFIVRILAEEPPAAQPADAPVDCHILLVDDDPVARLITKEHLAAKGFLVDDVADARAALDLLAQRRYAALVTDLTLGGEEDGAWLARQAGPALRAQGAWVMALSGQDPTEPAASRFDLWLTKPRAPEDRRWLTLLVARLGHVDAQPRPGVPAGEHPTHREQR